MRAPYSLSCLFLLSLGTCLPRGELAHPGHGSSLKPSWQRLAAEDWGGRRAAAERRRSQELSSLLGIARELRGLGKQGARRQLGGQGGSELLPTAGEKRSGALGSLAEELNGYNRRRGGFTFRFGR
ncbi:orexigenic neuropeptide QRFP [Melanerpes formicivorus]|uniref:orexigenic neuropeptide QRFP n=1 Tax=Melanerpes formicivorus TaxID=211600 RepID=UPI00358F39D8